MKHLLKFFLIIFVVGCASMKKKELSPEFAKWAAIKSPTAGDTQIYGTYQAGCIAGAKPLPLSGTGYYVAHMSRARFYGHPTMIAYLTELGEKLKKKKYPTMLIGDISYPRGGPFLNGHASHQVGLDADISLTASKLLPAEMSGEDWAAPSFVQGRKVLLESWSKEQTQLIEQAADSASVNRIFVSPAIKKYFCETHATSPWLYKLRSWWGHDDHIHVRLNCPSESVNCKSQAALDPSNNGCGKDLDWWFSAEADAEAAKMEAAEETNPEPRTFPVLPPECEAIKNSI